MLRRFTKDQFSTSGTIDGNRIARTLAGLVSRFNALQAADLEARWVETKYHTHYRGVPVSVGTQPYYPFVRTDAGEMQSIGETLPDPAQRWRHKGVDVEGLGIDSGGTYQGIQYAWTTSFWFERPAVIQRVTAMLQTDSEYTNTFAYPGLGTFPPGGSANEPCKDIQVLLYVANPFLVENASQDALELLRRDFESSAQDVSPIPASAVTGTMLPAANGDPAGLMIDFEFHEVHIPSKSRVYMALVLPQYASAYNTAWDDETVWRQFYSLTLTALEQLEQ